MEKKGILAFAFIFALGIAVGLFAAKAFDTSLYHGKPPKDAARALLELGRKQAGKGSWERIGVGRVYYLGGMKAEGQAIFDEVTSHKPAATDWWRIGRIYWEAGEWPKAREAFEKSLAMNPKDDKGLAELGAYYMIKGDRAHAEELYDRSFSLESGEVWNTSMMAGGYLGVRPQEYESSERRLPAGRSAGFQPAPAGCRRTGRQDGGAPNQDGRDHCRHFIEVRRSQ